MHQTPPTDTTLKERTARGLLWGLASSGGQQLLNLVFGICLARLLTPADYGMVGMLALFALLAGALQESGFISALNQKAQATHQDFNAVFWFNVFMGLLLYAVLFLLAPLIALWFRQPALVPLARYSFLSFVLASLGTAHRAYLFRQLRVKQTAAMTLTALTVSGVVGVTMAALGFSYWGIATQTLVYCGMMSLLSWCLSGWRPTLPISLRPLRSMIGFSSKLLLTNVFMHIGNNLFSIFLGRFYGERSVGFFNQANKWTTVGHTFLSGALWNVTEPVFARISTDHERRERALRKMIRFTCLTSFPALLGLALIAPEFITLTITAKWLPSAHLMQLLCVGGAFIPLQGLYGRFLVSQGRSNVFMWQTVVVCLLQLILLIALRGEGVERMVLAYVVLGVASTPVWHAFVRSEAGLRFRTILADQLPFLLSAVAACAVGMLLSAPLSGLVAVLLTKILSTAAVYLVLVWLYDAPLLRECLTALRGRRI